MPIKILDWTLNLTEYSQPNSEWRSFAVTVRLRNSGRPGGSSSCGTVNDFQIEDVDQLLSLSMVWANNVFMGCRYNTELLDKVKEMAEGIEVVDAPVFKTRDEIMKKQQGR
ncbi:N-terminal-like protein CDKN2A-interacting protein [Collichthys lucidus]|uniref:N-terminal-like protein CDKN2A-interacting protein n=1 Tax=Collichthys lucidus TaxID=240159 RepID=A0A4U5V694_COLLU|nr:N-terminal-like protein CDKN2A-interacting protein [Collichthys lucidus]